MRPPSLELFLFGFLRLEIRVRRETAPELAFLVCEIRRLAYFVERKAYLSPIPAHFVRFP